MPGHRRPEVPSARISFERRRSDFEPDGRVTPFTGSCCCSCCCLHWLTGAAGGIVGMRMGWVAAQKKSANPPHPVVKQALYRGLAVGIVLVVVVLGVVISAGLHGGIAEYILMAAAFVPSVVFIPIGVTMILSSHGLKYRMVAAFRREAAKLPPKEGSSQTSLYRAKQQAALKTRDELLDFHVFCRHCWCDLDESLHLTACPDCNAPIRRPVLSGPDYGTGIAWRATWMSVALSSAGTAVGYLVMWLIATLSK